MLASVLDASFRYPALLPITNLDVQLTFDANVPSYDMREHLSFCMKKIWLHYTSFEASESPQLLPLTPRSRPTWKSFSFPSDFSSWSFEVSNLFLLPVPYT